MKNFKKPMNILILSALMLGSCNDPIAEPNPTPNTDYSIIEGDTIKNRIEKEYTDKKTKEKLIYGNKQIIVGEETVTYKEPKLHTPPTKDPDLSKIKNNNDPDLKGKPLRMIAIGGSLTAGVRDGGYFNEGMITSYPNLIARQMKLKKFEQPLFDKADYNGFGRKVPTTENPTKGPVSKFKAVNNNSGVEAIIETSGAFDKGRVQNIVFKRYSNYQNIDNYAVPNFPLNGVSPFGTINSFDGDSDDKTNRELVKRIANEIDSPFSKQIFNKKFDFFIYEIGSREIMDMILLDKPLGFSQYPDNNVEKTFNFEDSYIQTDIGINIQIKFLKILANNKAQYACFLNLPPLTKLPYFYIIDRKKIQEVINTYTKGYLVATEGLGLINTGTLENYYPLPTSEIDSLLSPVVHPSLKKGLSQERPLNAKSFVRFDKAEKFIADFNTQTTAFGRIFNAPIVDLYGLYEKILAGTYITDDGVKVDGNFPTGNFFSSDAIHPTAFGQAVIANEAIKALNTHYKMEIPLIPTREYLSVK